MWLKPPPKQNDLDIVNNIIEVKLERHDGKLTTVVTKGEDIMIGVTRRQMTEAAPQTVEYVSKATMNNVLRSSEVWREWAKNEKDILLKFGEPSLPKNKTKQWTFMKGVRTIGNYPQKEQNELFRRFIYLVYILGLYTWFIYLVYILGLKMVMVSNIVTSYSVCPIVNFRSMKCTKNVTLFSETDLSWWYLFPH